MQKVAVLWMIRQRQCFDCALVCPCAHAIPELSYISSSFCVCMHVLIYSIGNSTSRANRIFSGRFDIEVT